MTSITSKHKPHMGEKVLEKIKTRGLRPEPRWKFLIRNYLVWFLGGVALVVGSISFSVIIYLVGQDDWDAYAHVSKSLTSFIVLGLPYFWVIAFALFIVTAHFNIKHTKRGYRIELKFLIAALVAINMFFGAVLNAAGGGKVIDNILTDRVPLYEKMFEHKKARWLNPEKGLLAGMITNVKSQNNFTLVDPLGKEWNIFFSNKGWGFKNIRENSFVRLYGKTTVENNFWAEKVLGPKDHIKGMFKKRMQRSEMLRSRPPTNPGDKLRLKNKILKRDMENIGAACRRHNDCRTPFDFAARSSCPFEAKCINNKCAVICPDYYASIIEEQQQEPMCENNKDCDCAFYSAEDKIDCACVDGICSAIVAR